MPFISNWISFTPTLSAATDDPTLGSGSTAAGSCVILNDLVVVHIYIEFGASGVDPGSGTYSIDLPFAASTHGSVVALGSGYVYDDSASDFYLVSAVSASSGTVVQLGLDGSGATTSGLVDNNSPIVFDTSDAIALNLTYRFVGG